MDMFLILRTIVFGAVTGAALGLSILSVTYLAHGTNPDGNYDRYGYVVFVLMLFGAAFGALFGLAASAGAYLKKKFEGEEVKK